MVEIFKTDVEDQRQAKQILTILRSRFPAFQVNFDLQDCDKILRVKGEHIPVDEIISLVSTSGFYCSLLN